MKLDARHRVCMEALSMILERCIINEALALKTTCKAKSTSNMVMILLTGSADSAHIAAR